MPLTPTDVANKQFRIAFRGYSLDEVDAFLDEVENELSRLLRDNAALKDRGGAAASAPAPLAQTPDAPAPAAVAAAPLASMEGQEAALRTLLLAQRTADEAIAEARAEAEEIVSSARKEAESTLSAARSEAESTLTSARTESERTLNEAQGKAARIDQEVASRIQAATGDLDARRRALEGRIEELRAFEREYRTRLKAYLENQLRELGSGAGPDDSGAGVPAGARTAAVGLAAPPAGPVPVSGPGGPGTVPRRAGGRARRPAARGGRPLDAARRAAAGLRRHARRPVHVRPGRGRPGRGRRLVRPLTARCSGRPGPVPCPAAARLHAPLAPTHGGPTT